MIRSDAAEMALQAFELEREAIKHCDSLDNPKYQEFMHKHNIAALRVKTWIDANPPALVP